MPAQAKSALRFSKKHNPPIDHLKTMRWPAHPIQSIKSRLLHPFTGTITRVDTSQPSMALTFDDGPHPDYTPRVLELLAAHQAKATFFVVGQAAEQHPDLIDRIRAQGHALANHTYSHALMTAISRQERRDEVLACARLIGPQATRLFRPPWGAQSHASRRDLRRLGYQVVAWDTQVEDWLRQPPTDLAKRIISQARSGSIVLLHDAVRPAKPDSPSCLDRGYLIEALSIALPVLASGYRMVTVPELLSLGRPVYRPWIFDPAA